MPRYPVLTALILGGLTLAPGAQAAISIATVLELTGTAAIAGLNFKSGLEMARQDINDQGGILGEMVEFTESDSRSDPQLAKTLTKEAIARGAFAVMGPVASSSVMASMAESRAGGVPTFVGASASAITQGSQGYVYRTSLTQSIAMPKLAYYLNDKAHIKRLVSIYVNNDFGQGGMAALRSALAGSNTQIVGELRAEPGQTDYAALVAQAKSQPADAVFIYLNEAESAHLLKELRRQSWATPIIGETTAMGQKVIELAGPAANGVIGHMDLAINAPVPAMRQFKTRYQARYHTDPDHNSMKGYLSLYLLKAAADKAGKLDRKAIAEAMKTLKVNTDRHSGALMYTEFNERGDLDRMSFMVEVKDGRQVVTDFMPPLSQVRSSSQSK